MKITFCRGTKEFDVGIKKACTLDIICFWYVWCQTNGIMSYLIRRMKRFWGVGTRITNTGYDCSASLHSRSHIWARIHRRSHRQRSVTSWFDALLKHTHNPFLFLFFFFLCPVLWAPCRALCELVCVWFFLCWERPSPDANSAFFFAASEPGRPAGNRRVWTLGSLKESVSGRGERDRKNEFFFFFF